MILLVWFFLLHAYFHAHAHAHAHALSPGRGITVTHSPKLDLPKKRPDLVEEEGGGGFWICDAVGARDWRMEYVRCIVAGGDDDALQDVCMLSVLSVLSVFSVQW